ncbi:type II toxin-antitoxin system HicB family antitoxin [Duganella sp. BuS-21]|uniref:type II toxin-antitoxin system HicB family antitoxin n=1 Tax=Duganella sp. BuS-21 TaxID=2943848 RepID=UPI0035A5B38E
MDKVDDYPYEIRQLTAEEGGGYLVRYTDFWGCMSDGETVEEAIANARAALIATIATLREDKLPVPIPHSRQPRIASA